MGSLGQAIFDDGFSDGFDNGFSDGFSDGVLNSIKNLVKNLHLSNMDAMKALGIAEEDQDGYLKLLQ